MMFSFLRKPPQTINDPVFGQLTLNRRFGWEGKVPSPVNGENISVFLHRKDSSPTSEDRDTLLHFINNFSSSIPLVKQELLNLLRPYLDDPEWEMPKIQTPDELWRMVQLEALSIFPNKPLEISFGFRDDDVWPDATFNLSVDGADVKGVSLDD